jgi:hypothetical protein
VLVRCHTGCFGVGGSAGHPRNGYPGPPVWARAAAGSLPRLV